MGRTTLYHLSGLATIMVGVGLALFYPERLPFGPRLAGPTSLFEPCPPSPSAHAQVRSRLLLYRR